MPAERPPRGGAACACRESGEGAPEVVAEHRAVVGVGALLDDPLGPLLRREAAQVREPLLGHEDVDVVLGVVDVGDHRDDARDRRPSSPSRGS